MNRWKCLVTAICFSSGIQAWAIAGDQQHDYKMQLQHEAFKAIAIRQKLKTELIYRESSDWFGKTGLSDDVERSLPRQIRQKLGQFVGDKGSIKAHDLEYIGVYPALNGDIHYWKLPVGYTRKSNAYLLVDNTGHVTFGLGDSLPQELE